VLARFLEWVERV